MNQKRISRIISYSISGQAIGFTDSWKEKREVGQSGLNDISFSCGKRLETSVPPKCLRNSPEVFDMLSSRRQTTGYKLNV